MSPAHSGILGEVISKIAPNWKKKLHKTSKFLHQNQKLKIAHET